MCQDLIRVTEYVARGQNKTVTRHATLWLSSECPPLSTRVWTVSGTKEETNWKRYLEEMSRRSKKHRIICGWKTHPICRVLPQDQGSCDSKLHGATACWKTMLYGARPPEMHKTPPLMNHGREWRDDRSWKLTSICLSGSVLYLIKTLSNKVEINGHANECVMTEWKRKRNVRKLKAVELPTYPHQLYYSDQPSRPAL